jgi:hypothetical protein
MRYSVKQVSEGIPIPFRVPLLQRHHKDLPAGRQDTFGFLWSSIKCTTTLREVELDNSPSA